MMSISEFQVQKECMVRSLNSLKLWQLNVIESLSQLSPGDARRALVMLSNNRGGEVKLGIRLCVQGKLVTGGLSSR